jgi:hypothetical protein
MRESPDGRNVVGEESAPGGRKAGGDTVKLLVSIACLTAALATPALAWASDQAYISWSLGDRDGRPTVTWEISGSTRWYVGAIQIASDDRVGPSGNFLPENVVAYEVLAPEREPGFWVGPIALQPGKYYGRLRLRFDGPCSANCQSATSVRSFRIDPPPLRALRWKARAGVGRVIVSWRKPRNGWYVSMVMVDDNRRFTSPEDAVAWPTAPARTRWASTLLARDRYHVRLRLRHANCESCVLTSPTKIVDVKRANSPPVLKPARFEVVRRNAKTLRHTWRATFTACDQTQGDLRLQIREETGRAGGRVRNSNTRSRRLAEPDGCRTYTVRKRSAFPFRPGTFVRVTLQVRDGLGVWSLRTRKVVWTTTG